MAKKDITNTDLVKIEPITDNQKLVFDSYGQGKHQFLFGCAFVWYFSEALQVGHEGDGTLTPESASLIIGQSVRLNKYS